MSYFYQVPLSQKFKTVPYPIPYGISGLNCIVESVAHLALN